MAARGVGTYNFMAPEQLDSDSTFKVSTKSDMYSFGCVMLDVLTGRAPFTDVPPKAIYKTVVMEEQPPPELKLLTAGSPVLLFTFSSCFLTVGVMQEAGFITKCLSQDPNSRPTASEAVRFCTAQLAESEQKRSTSPSKA